VIHRDIKPANILLHDGSALVADFGIAIAASKAGSRMTETGMSLGTPEYMSPEQAMGERDLDARSDVYALGCVLYEMLTGEAPFTGPTAQAIVAKVMTATPAAPETLRNTVPPGLNDAVMTALQKLPADRFRSAADFAAAITQPATGGVRASGAVPSARRTKRGPLPWIAGGVVGFAAAFLAFGPLLHHHVDAPVALGRATHLTWDPGLEVLPALSPDGKSVAYTVDVVAAPRVMVRTIAGGRALALTGDTTHGESNPVWLPDGSRILFLSRGGVFSAPAGGGPARPEIPAAGDVPIASVTPSPDGNQLAFSRFDSLFIRQADGTIRFLAKMLEPALCSWSPDGDFIACAAGNLYYAAPGSVFGNLSPGRIALARVRDGHVTTVTDSLSLNTSPAWSPDGQWLYFVSNRDGPRDIYTIPIARNGTAGAEPIRLSAGLGAHTISSSKEGTSLAYSLWSTQSSVWWMPLPTHPGGTTTDATLIVHGNENIENFRGSADGKWLYYDSDIAGNDEIFRIPVAGGERERLTNNPADDFSPMPSPDGKEFVFHSWRGGSRDIYLQQLDGSGVEQLTNTPNQEYLPLWSPDGKAIAFSSFTGFGGIWVMRRDARGTWGPPLQRVVEGGNGAWSPDGKSLAYLSTLSGGGIMITPADSGPARKILDASIPGTPAAALMDWARDNRIIFSSADTRGRYTLYSLSPAGGTPEALLHWDQLRQPTTRGGFSLAGDRLYFSSEEQQGDVWVMELRKAR
jgi:serine/threonine-protein kinase